MRSRVPQVFAYHDTAKDSTFDGAATIAHGMLSIGNLDGTLFAFTLAHEGFCTALRSLLTCFSIGVTLTDVLKHS